MRATNSSDQLLALVQAYSKKMVALASIDEVLWLLAHEVMGVLNFEDCVIYLVDPERNILVQKAAFGPKNPEGQLIKDPIEIAIGAGIVGDAAKKQTAQRVDDTLLDERYILDDEARRSELAVPIVYEGKTIGVIDSEHSDPQFYTSTHQSFIEAIANITASKLADSMRLAELERMTKALEDSHRNLKTQSAEALQFARSGSDLLDLRRSLLSRISHEMKTPLNAVIGMSELLLLDAPEGPMAEPLRIIHEAGTHLNETVSLMLAFLEIRGLGERKESFRAVHFRTYVAELIAGRSNGVLPEHAELDLNSFEYLGVDVDALTQILEPIVDNALKFDPSHQLRLSAHSIDFDGDPGLRVKISDQGPGIAADIHDSLFEPFIHGQIVDHQLPTGRGLGLALAKTIADSLGWRLSFDPLARPGATFILEMRVMPPN